MRNFALGITILLANAFVTVLAAAEFYVAPGGDDAAAGTLERPFDTLTRARDACRKLPAGEAKRIRVRGGKYFNVALRLEREDSGLVLEAAPGERPILYGGQPITGWRKDGDNFYAAPLPALPVLPGPAEGSAKSRAWEVRLLQVDGQFARRARFPAQGTLAHLTSFDVPWMSTTGGGWKRKPTVEELTTLQYRPEDLSGGLEVTNAEITVFHMWDESCVGVAAQDAPNHILTLAPPLGHPPGAFGVKKFVLWNIREGMTAPGQWYHDRARNRLVYWPLPGQDMSRAEVIAPTTTTILRLAGQPGARVKNVVVRGLSFAVTTVPLKAGGFAAEHYDGAISLDETENCAFAGLTIARGAGHGINARGNVTGTRVLDCDISECGAGGVYVGGAGAVISNNLVHAVGLAYPSAVGIYRGGRNCLVTHNELHDCPYSAMSYGGHSNVIADNLIYDCMKVLHDGAAIYVFGSKGSILRGNVARDINSAGASAYYLDEQCRDCVVEGNFAQRVGWPSHNHMATNNVIRNNLFLVTGDARLTFPRCTGYKVERNVVYATGAIRIENPDAVTNWSGNLLFSVAGKIERVRLKDYARAGAQEGAPGDTLVADPQFENLEQGDYRYRAGSPARALGIPPIDVSRAGRARP